MIHTEPTNDFERLRHYQTLKANCLRSAIMLATAIGDPDTAEDVAKAYFRSIIEERWGSEPVAPRT